MKTINIVAQKRTEMGSTEARRLRREGWVPCVINDWTGKSTMVRVNRHDFELMLHRHGRENVIADLQVEGDTARKVIMREVQRDPVKHHVQHVDFMEISMTRKMKIEIPIVLVGDAPGVTQEMGVLQQILRVLTVECLPGDMVDVIKVDVSALKVGDSIAVKDLKVDSKLTVITSGEVTIAAVTAQMAEEEVAPEAAVEGATAEPEVITAKKPEDEEGAEGEEGEAKGKGDAKGKAEAKPKGDAKAGGKAEGADKAAAKPAAKPEGKAKK